VNRAEAGGTCLFYACRIRPEKRSRKLAGPIRLADADANGDAEPATAKPEPDAAVSDAGTHREIRAEKTSGKFARVKLPEPGAAMGFRAPATGLEPPM
jgi:hypothetical protein